MSGQMNSLDVSTSSNTKKPYLGKIEGVVCSVSHMLMKLGVEENADVVVCDVLVLARVEITRRFTQGHLQHKASLHIYNSCLTQA